MGMFEMNRRRFIVLLLSTASSALAACRKRVVQPAPVATRQAVATLTATPIEPSPTPTIAPLPTSTPTPTPSPTPQPTPTPAPVVVRLWVEPGLPDALAGAARDLHALIEQHGRENDFIVDTTSDSEIADLSLTTHPGDGTRSIAMGRTPLALVTSPRVPLLGVSSEQASAITAGAVSDWSDVGSPQSIPLVLLVFDVNSVPDATHVDSYEALLQRFATDSGAVALVPVDDVDFRAHALRIDNIDILANPEKAGQYALQQQLFLEIDPSAPLPETTLLPPIEPNAIPPVYMTNHEAAVTVTIVGDIILGRTVNTIMTRLNDFAAPFRLVADELKQSDLTIGDLECSLSDSIAPPSDPYTFLFITSAAAVEGLTLAGIDGVSRANNHSMNFGAAGMHDTAAALDAAGIRHFGIGDTLAEARQPGLFEVKGVRIAFLGFDGITGGSYGATDASAGTSPLIVENLEADITAARQQAELVIPYIHWGVEYTLEPTTEQRTIARRAIDAGADLVVGSHPHWVQGMEIYQGKPIIYSLANFVFDQDWSEETKQGLIMHLTFQGSRLVALRFVPVYIEDFYRPRIVDGSEQVTILNRLWTSTDAIQAHGEP
jgi:poly-gamma-glutamate synthesis protein (capsule biosynthesis protein)